MNNKVLGILALCAYFSFAVSNASAAEKTYKCVFPKSGDVGKFIASKLSTSLTAECPTCTDAKIRVKLKPVKQTGGPILAEGLAGVSKPEGADAYKPVFTEGYEILSTECVQNVAAQVRINYKVEGVKKSSTTDVTIKLNGISQ